MLDIFFTPEHSLITLALYCYMPWWWVNVTSHVWRIFSKEPYTARNVQVAASLLQACCLAVIKPISGCVRIACSGLLWCKLSTSLLQVDCQDFLSTSLMQIVLTCSKSPNIKLQQFCVSQACCNLLTTCSKPVKSKTCSKSVVFLGPYI